MLVKVKASRRRAFAFFPVDASVKISLQNG